MTHNYNVFFEHDLMLVLRLEAEGNKVEISAGNIERVSLDLHSYGFVGNIEFSGVDNNELVSLYNSKKEMKATLTFQSTGFPAAGLPLLEIKGIVIQKCFKRVDDKNKVNSYAVRHYEIVICDSAQATWSQHCPIQVYVDESMKDVVEEHKNPELSIKYDFQPIEKKHPIIAFSLASSGPSPHSEQDHFYSFLHWYLHQEGGIWNYDYKTNSYAIFGKKPPSGGSAYKIKDYWVAPPVVICDRPIRYNIQTLKHSADSLDTENKERETAFKSVRRDEITNANYRAFPEHAYETVRSTPEPEYPQAECELLQLAPDFHLDKLIPGSYLTFFSGGSLETWSSDPFFLGKTFRSRALVFEADKVGLTEKLEKPLQTYRLYVKVLLEREEETFVERPSFTPPVFPFTIQGKVFSDLGDKEQSTYKVSDNEQLPQGHYLVSVPLAKNKNVVVPFTPDLMSGQYYFPFCKGERVLLSMYFHTAKIQRIIDWQPLARLPAGVQGNQIVLSSNGREKYAIIKHEFEGGQDSVITIKQATSEAQTQTVEIRDRDLTITVVEENKQTLTIELNGDAGLILSLRDQEGEKTQRIVFDGDQIISTCANSSDTSTYIQTPESVMVQCKEFQVNAEKIVLDAKESITQNSLINVDIETPIANIKAAAVKMG